MKIPAGTLRKKRGTMYAHSIEKTNDIFSARAQSASSGPPAPPCVSGTKKTEKNMGNFLLFKIIFRILQPV